MKLKIGHILFTVFIIAVGCAPFMKMIETGSTQFQQSGPIKLQRQRTANLKYASMISDNMDQGHRNRIKDFYVLNKGNSCQLVIRMDFLTAYNANTLGKPHRLYIDLDNTIIQPANQQRTINDGFIKRIRTGQHNARTVRIVLDTNEKVDYTIATEPSANELIVEFFPARPKEFLPVWKNPSPVMPVTDPHRKAKPVEIPGVKQSRHSATLIQELGLKIHTIIIDPGHGGKDPGAVGPNNLYEKDLTLDIALRLRKLLLRDGSFNVLLTREDDRYISLEERTEFANRNNGDLFLSIHVNSNPYATHSGIETYYLSLAKDEESRAVAAFENRSSTTNLGNLEQILGNIMKNSKIEESSYFAEIVQKNLIIKTRQDNRGVKTAGFFVLIGARMPSILAEVGFISNAHDRKLLKHNAYRDVIAKSLYSGIKEYREQLAINL